MTDELKRTPESAEPSETAPGQPQAPAGQFDEQSAAQLARMNEQLRREIGQCRRAEEKSQRQADLQAVVNRLLLLCAEDTPLDQLLQRALDLLVSIPWLSLESKGAVFLVPKGGRHLVMAANKGLPESVRLKCAEVAFGHCLCGQAAESGDTVFADCVDERHETMYNGIEAHGHYCVPLTDTGSTIGVLTLYVKEGHPRKPEEEDFLAGVAAALAGIITHRRAREDLRHAQERLRENERLAAIGQTVASISHCMKNFFTPVRLGIDLLARETQGRLEDHSDVIAMLSRAAARLEILLMEMLDQSRDREVVCEPTDLQSLFDEAARMLAPQAEHHGVRIQTEVTPEAAQALTDSQQLFRAILNLGTNAIDAMPNGGLLAVRASVVSHDGATGVLAIEVSDTGPGILPDAAERMFEPFFSTKGSMGTGLGLSFVKSFVDQSRGAIKVESAPGARGTVIRMLLPAGGKTGPVEPE